MTISLSEIFSFVKSIKNFIDRKKALKKADIHAYISNKKCFIENRGMHEAIDVHYEFSSPNIPSSHFDDTLRLCRKSVAPQQTYSVELFAPIAMNDITINISWSDAENKNKSKTFDLNISD